ncbi:hypothetical protein [Fluviicola sp.]|uniref:hypothetical protein n=1 Tax=Fluviicola sp. TaxID=1917219 RepID=UPI00260ADB31|nr:hypothetical protein [Fluviicola sp.]
MRIVEIKLLIIFLYFLSGCEYHHHSNITNESGSDVEVVVYFNRQVFEDAWGKDSYFPFLRSYNNEPPRVTLLDFDSINLISHYRIQNKGFFSISHGLGGKIIVPTYEDFVSMTVISKVDTIKISTPQEFKNKFRPDGRNNFEWVIK